MSSDRTFRSLTALRTASSSRVLNLLAIGQLHANEDGFSKNPFFVSRILNNAIIVKHRLRADEVELFRHAKPIATKVIVPFEGDDLRSGGKSLLVAQRGYEELLRELGNYGHGTGFERDLRVLDLIDKIPSLDPFLLREHLRGHDISPDPHYFEISEADQRRMFDFAASQVRRLTELAGGSGSHSSATARMVAALLSSQVNEKLEPLRQTLQLNDVEFREGVFSWRGFLYYKWSLMEFWPSLIRSLKQLKVIKHIGPADSEQKTYFTSARETIIAGAKQASDDIRGILGVYDKAYEGLIAERDPRIFRDFLLNAPSLFLEIGDKMGALSHITSFWSYRFPEGAPRTVDADELSAIFQDFSKSILVAPQRQAA